MDVIKMNSFFLICVVFMLTTVYCDATQSMKTMPRSNSKVRGIIPPDSCTITAEELQQLIDMMSKFGKKSAEHNNLILSPTPRAASCAELISEMQTYVTKITAAYQEMLDTNISPEQYDALKREYEQKIADLNQHFDDLEQAANQESQREIEKLQKQLQDLNVLLQKALDELEAERKAHRETKIKLIIANVQANNINAAIQLYNELHEIQLMTRIITDAYTSINTYSNCDNFVYQTFNYDAWSLGYTALYDEMERHSDIQNQKVFNFAYIIKYNLEDPNTGYRNRFEALKGRFSQSVRLIIWAYSVCLKNKAYNEYLYSPNNYFDYDGDRARVFTWVKGSPVTESPMRFELQSKGDYFYIKNTYRNRYMYSPNSYFNYDNDRRRVFFWKSGSAVSNGDWIVKIKSYDTISLLSRTNQQYLYAASSGFNYDSDRRRVFTWIPGAEVNQSPFQLHQC